MSSSSETGPQACRSADTPQGKATASWATLEGAKPRDGVELLPALLGVGKAAPEIEPSLGPCPQFGRDKEKPKMVRDRSSTGNTLALSQGLD